MTRTTSNATDGASTGGRKTGSRELPAMLDVQDVAGLLTCSSRHVYRLSDAGKMPRPVKLGALVRWRRAELEKWIADGCPSCRKAGRP